MVTQHSATCGGQSDTLYNRQPIQANHSQMVKFSDRSNGDYLDVMKRNSAMGRRSSEDRDGTFRSTRFAAKTTLIVPLYAQFFDQI
jgi:hypothetical protein